MPKLTELNPLIDADTILYRAGFAAKDDEPLSHHIQTLKMMYYSILERFPERKYERLFLTGQYNFREQLATIQPYKGNRVARKPLYYKELREYMLEVLKAELIDGMEADDALGIAQWEARDKSTCIVTNDKDLKMIPGWHYNFTKDGPVEWVPLDRANSFFYQQMLSGDRTDNIPAIKGHGERTKGLQLVVDECGTDLVKWREKVDSLYRLQYGEDWEAARDECASLLWILRTPTTTWKDYV